jgi:hypothetical protein
MFAVIIANSLKTQESIFLAASVQKSKHSIEVKLMVICKDKSFIANHESLLCCAGWILWEIQS